MKTSSAGSVAFTACILAVVLPGCGASFVGTQAPTPMHAGARVSSSDLLYAGSISTLFVFGYPRTKYLFQITLPELGGGQVCSDANGDVFAPVGNSPPEIAEYAHGGSDPIAILNSPAGSDPYACAVDPTTGNLAVTNFGTSNVARLEIYQNASGTPTTYSDHEFRGFVFCAYDDRGNLFASGYGKGSMPYVLAMLPRGSNKFTNIRLKLSGAPGLYGLQWDGKHITVGSRRGTEIDRLKIHGKIATVIGRTDLGRIKVAYVSQYWFAGNVVIRAFGKRLALLGFWNYPVGGAPFQSVHHNFGSPGALGGATSVGSQP